MAPWIAEPLFPFNSVSLAPRGSAFTNALTQFKWFARSSGVLCLARSPVAAVNKCVVSLSLFIQFASTGWSFKPSMVANARIFPTWSASWSFSLFSSHTSKLLVNPPSTYISRKRLMRASTCLPSFDPALALASFSTSGLMISSRSTADDAASLKRRMMYTEWTSDLATAANKAVRSR